MHVIMLIYKYLTIMSEMDLIEVRKKAKIRLNIFTEKPNSKQNPRKERAVSETTNY
jgi:hypothetical protein